VGCTQPFKNREKIGFVFTPQSSKNQKQMSLNPTPLPPTLFFKKKKRKGLVHNPLAPPKKKMKTKDQINFCTNLINFEWKNLFCPFIVLLTTHLSSYFESHPLFGPNWSFSSPLKGTLWLSL
jgi:hypothetical protein